jgi:UDP-N-acetylmuramate dehydrogenase
VKEGWRRAIRERVPGELVEDAPLAPRTSCRIGGPADLLVRPRDPEALSRLLSTCAELAVPVFVLGGGANTLFADAGVRGVVLKLPQDFSGEGEEAGELVFCAGAPIARLVERARAKKLVGMEFLAGIPGTLGGAAVMNAGTKLGSMADIVSRVEVATLAGAGFVPASELRYAYRHSELPPGAVVTRVAVRLREGDLAKSAALMEADKAARRKSQPLDQPSWGSTFVNPPGDAAGRLLEAAGLKGRRIGQAMISEVHANFVVNLGGATAVDALALMRLARSTVKERFGVVLEPEVRRVGEFGNEREI